MKRFTFIKSFLLLCALIAGAGTAWADEVTETINLSEQGYKNAEEVSSTVGTTVTLTFDKGTSSNTPAYYSTGTGVRVYYGGKMIVTANNYTIIKVIVTFGKDKSPTISLTSNGTNEKAGNTSPATWEGNATEVYFNVSEKGHARIQKVEVTYDDGNSSSAVATTTTIDDSELTNKDLFVSTAAGQLKAVVKAGNTAIDGALVTWTSSKKDVATIASDGAVTLIAEGTTTITATYAGVANQYQASSATYELTVTNSDPNIPGSENNPYTVAQARAAIDAGTGVTGVCATGIVSQVDSYNSTYKSITYWISDDGTTTNQLEVYGGKGLNGADFSSKDDIKVGATVVVKGNLKKFNSTYEFDKDNQLVSITNPVVKADPELSYTTTEYEISKDETSSFVAPALNNPHSLAVTYSSNNETIALVDENTGDVVLDNKVGEATITATFAGDDTYKAGSASYTIKIFDPNAKGSKLNPYTIAEVIGGTAEGTDIYVQGYIVGEYVGKTTSPRTKDFQGNSNLALADEFTKSPTASESAPIQLPSGSALQTTWGLKANKGASLGYKILVKGDVDSYFSVTGIKNTSTIEAISVPATVTDAGWATWVTPFNVEAPSSTEAYSVKLNGTSTELTKLTFIPQDMPVLLKNAGSYEFPVTDAVPDVLIDNDLKVSDGTVTSANNAYVLANKSKGVGFYKWIGTSDSPAIPAGKVYLIYTASSAPDFIGFGDATGISSIENGQVTIDNSEVYNLAGQRVAQPTKGLYIINGKKYVVK